MIKRLLAACAAVLALVVVTTAQVAVPNTLVPGATITAAALNTNFTTIANHSLDRLSGGNISGTVTVDPGVTIDGVDIGATVCATCAPTFKDLVLASPATGITVATQVVVNSTGQLVATRLTGIVPDASFPATLPVASGANLTALNGTQITTGTVPAAQLTNAARLASNNVYTSGNDFLTYTETKTAPAITANVLTVNLALGTHFTVALNAAITTLTISNPAATGRAGSFTLAFTADGTPRAISWPGSVKWPSGVAPTMTSTNGKIDVFTFISYDGGTSWLAFVGGQNF